MNNKGDTDVTGTNVIKVLVVFGTRPEAIKMAPVVLALAEVSGLKCEICITAQHRQMLDQVMSAFELSADYDLDLMRVGQDLYDVTTGTLNGLRQVLVESKPDIVLAHGDTTTCFTAALSSFYAGIPVGHVEAGLRTWDMTAPFPEEANRSLVGRLAKWHFAPTEQARANLLAENVPSEQIIVTGNTVIDALLMAREKALASPAGNLQAEIGRECYGAVTACGKVRKCILITGHRRENFGQGFLDLCAAIKTLAVEHPDWCFVYPVHLNPKVQEPVHSILGNLENVFLIPPLDYLPFVWLMNACDLILTDSGGIQEEGPALGKPVLVMRDVTERPEALDAGSVRLVGTDTQRIIQGVEEVLGDEIIYNEMAKAISPYGDGCAAGRIVETLATALGQTS